MCHKFLVRIMLQKLLGGGLNGHFTSGSSCGAACKNSQSFLTSLTCVQRMISQTNFFVTSARMLDKYLHGHFHKGER